MAFTQLRKIGPQIAPYCEIAPVCCRNCNDTLTLRTYDNSNRLAAPEAGISVLLVQCNFFEVMIFTTQNADILAALMVFTTSSPQIRTNKIEFLQLTSVKPLH